MPESGSRRDALRSDVLRSILHEHLEELDFLWEQRERVLFAPDWTLHELGELEERAEAHLDGLRIGGDAAIDLARPALAGEEPGAATAAAFVFLAARTPALANELMDAIAASKDPARDGIRVALRHGEVNLVTDRLYELSVGADRHLRAFATDVLAFHRLRPPPEMERLLADDEPAVRRLAYAAAGRFGKLLTERHLQDALDCEDPTVQRVALEACARCGLPALVAQCRKASRRLTEALAFLGVVGTDEDIPALKTALGDPSLAPAALAAFGSLGNVAAMPLILQAMANPTLAVPAGEAFVQLVGEHDLRVARAPMPPPALDDPAGDVMDDLPPPDADRARALWEQMQSRFAPGGRWQAGLDVGGMDMGTALGALSLRSRRDVYLAARARDPKGTPDVELERRVRVAGDAASPPARR